MPANPDLGHCFVCSRPANTLEHVIPKWLQRRFNLWNQELLLPNNTSIPYRQLTVPACSRCNNEVFGKLESRVEQGIASESDLWKWANKIHYGLSLRDKMLMWDRRNPKYRIGEVIRVDDPLERDRHFLHAVAGDFRTDPDPFGSVFRFTFATEQPFKFAHFISTSSICISLGTWGLAAFVIDGQALKRDVATMDAFRRFPKLTTVGDLLFFFANCVEHLARHELGFDILMTDGLMLRAGPTIVHSSEPFNDERFRKICKRLGLEWVDTRNGPD